MKSLFLASAALLATLFVGVSAQAGFFGEAYLRASNARVEINDGGWRKAIDGQDITVTNSTTTASATGILNGAFDSDVSVGSPDVQRVFLGSPGDSANIADNEGFPTPTGSTALGASLSDATSSYAYADTTSRDLTGQLVNGVDGSGNEVAVNNSDVEVIASGLFDSNMETAFGTSDVGTEASFQFSTLTAGEFRLVFDYEARLELSLSAPPDFANGSAEVEFSYTGRGDKRIEGGEVFTIDYGDGVFTESGQFTSKVLAAQIGSNSFSFGRKATISMTSVPEPSSLAIFGLCSVGVCAVGYRRRRNA